MTYIVGHPIKNPGDFYGRYEQTARFFEIIGGTQTQSVSILGVRRAGKTSFLKYVTHPEVMAQYLPHPEQYVMVYIDMSYCKTPADFYYRVLMRLRRELGDKVVTTNLWRPSPPEETSIYDVETWLCEFADQRVVLLLDEFDHLRTSAFDQDFLTELRAMTGVLDYDLACVTASYWDLYQLGEHLGLPPTSPFYNIFYPTPIYLAGLETAETNALIHHPAIQSGVKLLDDEIMAIRKLAGTLPFFIQAAADLWLREKRQSGPVNTTIVCSQLVSELAPYFTQWWRHLTSSEVDLLRHVANDTRMSGQTYHEVEIMAARRRLLSYGLVQEIANELTINGEIFQTWILQQERVVDDNQEAASQNGNGRVNRAQIRRILTHHFDIEELRTLCFDMGLDFDELPGMGIQAKARDLVHYWEKRGQVDQLVQAIRFERGQIV